MTEARKLRVFLCHASQDKPVVRELYQRLLAEGWIDPWLDEEKLLPGQDWDMEIEKAVAAADIVIVCLSNQSVNKEGYVQRELRFALDIALEKPEETIFIIPLRLEECIVPRRLKTFEYADYFPLEKWEDTYRRLMKSLQRRAKSLGLGKKKETSKQVVTVLQKTGAQIDQSPPKKVPTIDEIVSKLPPYKSQPAVCEVCHRPFGFLEQAVICDSCGAQYHKRCGYKLMDLRLTHTCLKCGKSIGREKFRDSAR